MIIITPDITIDEKEIQEEFVQSGGPGGQNVNKVASAVQLRFNAAGSPSLPEDVRGRLLANAGSRITRDGFLVIRAHRFRTQKANRKDAYSRLISLLKEATQEPKVRHRTRPSLTAKKRRLDDKRKRSALKRLRRPLTKAPNDY